MSLIIFTGIVVGLPRAVQEIYTKLVTGDWNVFHLTVILIMEVRGIKDVTPIPHNGCRPPKRRRV